MKEKEIQGLKIELYDDIAELPVVRFQKFNKMMLIDSGIGSDLNDFDTHIERLRRYIHTGDSALAIQELENMRQQIYFITENISPKHLAFAVLVKSIDGVPCDDISDSGIEETRKRLEYEPQGLLHKVMESAKKKIDNDLITYFPGIFDDTAVKEYFDLLKRHTMVELDALINKKPTPPEADEIMGQLLTFAKPQMFSGSDGVEVKYDRQFEDMCLMLTKSTGQNAREMTVFSFYNALIYIREQRKQHERIHNKHK